MMRKSKLLPALTLALVAASCTTITPTTGSPRQTRTASSRWTDSVLASMTLREKAAQIVWPSVFGDYVYGDSPQWRRLTQYIQQEKVGGFTISVGSPIEVAAKLNALQAMSRIPLLFGADLEAGAGFRARGGYFIPNAIDLGGAVVAPPEMAIGDTGVNSHLALPVVTVSRSRLDSVELIPFKAAVDNGVGAIMSFHGSMPALDSSGVPGTLSAKVLTGLLRNELQSK